MKVKFRMYNCSFCGKGQNRVLRLIAGPGGVYVCDSCVAKFRQRFADTQTREGRRCSFCGKREQMVQYMVGEARQACICSECLDLCSQIIDEEKAHLPKGE